MLHSKFLCLYNMVLKPNPKNKPTITLPSFPAVNEINDLQTLHELINTPVELKNLFPTLGQRLKLQRMCKENVRFTQHPIFSRFSILQYQFYQIKHSFLTLKLKLF